MLDPSPLPLLIRLSGLRIHASVGILAHELAQSQDILVNLSVARTEAPPSATADRIDAVLDYRLLRELCIDECTRAHVNLIETLAARMADRVMALPGVRECRVEVVKPTVFADAQGVSVEVHRKAAA